MEKPALETEDLKYPIGRFTKPSGIDREGRERCIRAIAQAPEDLRAAVSGLSPSQLDTPYREGGWTVRQVVHHLPDSHLNAYVRFKLALTEEEPPVRTYQEQLWAEIPDARSSPIELSLALFQSLHERWVASMRGLPDSAFVRTYRHPEDALVTLHQQLAHYAWHGRHHIAQIASLRRRMGWL